jgi:hypothetical protein
LGWLFLDRRYAANYLLSAEFWSGTALVRRNKVNFYCFLIMRQALLMRRTIEIHCIAVYQRMQSFAHHFVCANTTASLKYASPATRRSPC